MQRPENLHRIFNKSDEEMLQEAEVKLALFNEKKSMFIPLFPEMADPFADEWAITILNAQKLDPDFVSRTNQTGKTDILRSQMKQGRDLYQTLLIYLQLAYPDDVLMRKIMCQPQYNAARNNEYKLPVLLNAAYKQASKQEYKDALVAKGMKASDIELLNSLSKSIADQHTNREKSKKDRSLDADERIRGMNEVWENVMLVCHCAKLVFKDDAVLYKMFLLDESSDTGPSADTATS